MIYNCDIFVQTSRRNPFPAKISAYNVRYKTPFFYEIHPDLLLFIFVSSPVKLFLYLWKFFENGYLLELHHLYLFIYLFFHSFDNRWRWIHKIREYSRGKLLSLMLMFYAWQFDDTWPRVSIIWARVSTYGGSPKRKGTLDGNIFRQHHRGIVRMKFSRSGSTRLCIPG